MKKEKTRYTKIRAKKASFTVVASILVFFVMAIIFYILFSFVVGKVKEDIAGASRLPNHMKLATLLRTRIMVDGQSMSVAEGLAVSEDNPLYLHAVQRELYNTLSSSPQEFGSLYVEYQKKEIDTSKNQGYGQYGISYISNSFSIGAYPRDFHESKRRAKPKGDAYSYTSVALPTISGKAVVVYLITYKDEKKNVIDYRQAVAAARPGDKIYSPEGVFVFWGSVPAFNDPKGYWSIDGYPCFAVPDPSGKEGFSCADGSEIAKEMKNEYFVDDAAFKAGKYPAFVKDIDESSLEYDENGCIIPLPGQTQYFFTRKDGEDANSRSQEDYIGSCIHHPVYGDIIYWGSYGLLGNAQVNNHVWCSYDVCPEIEVAKEGSFSFDRTKEGDCRNPQMQAFADKASEEEVLSTISVNSFASEASALIWDNIKNTITKDNQPFIVEEKDGVKYYFLGPALRDSKYCHTLDEVMESID